VEWLSRGSSSVGRGRGLVKHFRSSAGGRLGCWTLERGFVVRMLVRRGAAGRCAHVRYYYTDGTAALSNNVRLWAGSTSLSWDQRRLKGRKELWAAAVKR
jgi:hypothetical protein